MQESSQHKNPSGVVISPFKVLLLHVACGLSLASAFWIAHNVYSVSLIQNPTEALRILWVFEASVVILIYSLFRQNPDRCSYKKAILRGLLVLPLGAVVNALGAIVLGAPVGIAHFKKTVHWSLLMSVFTFVPAASVFGSSWSNWHRVFSHTKPSTSIDFMICLPAHGAVIGAWLGAWPMPLDWERLWQEWPICVTYGAIVGYSLGMILSFGLVVLHHQRHRLKGD